MARVAAAKKKGVLFEENEWTEVEKVILRRRSVRLYKKKQVSESMIHRILEAGRFAPSAGNCQPWKFIVIRDKDLLDELIEYIVKFCKIMRNVIDYRRRPVLKPSSKLLSRLRYHDLNPIPSTAIRLIAEGKLGLFHGAPTVIIILKDIRGIGSPDLDCGIAGQNMVLAAHGMGLGTCWVSFVSPIKFSRKWKKRLGIEFPYEILTSIAVGYPRGEPDGFITRETHETDWYENGEKKVIY